MAIRYTPTTVVDEKIRDAYLKQRKGGRHALTVVTREIGWSKSGIARRGAALCLTGAREYHWSDAEEQILEKFGHLTASTIQGRLAHTGFRRSCATIKLKLTRFRIKQNLDGYSACALALALGVDTQKVCVWIKRACSPPNQDKPNGAKSKVETLGGSQWPQFAGLFCDIPKKSSW